MDEVSSHPVELSNLCRICVEKSTNLINLFEKWQNGLTLAKMLSDCIQKSVHQSDGRPTNICLTCVSSLVSAFEFFVVERDSEDKLKRLLGTSTIPAVKQEPEPEEEQYNEQVIPMDFVISDFGPIDCKNEDSFDGSTLFDADDGENSFQDDAGPSRTKKNGIKSKPKRGKQPKMKDKPVQKEPMKTKTKKKKRSKSSSPSHWRLARDSKQFECYKCKIVLPLFSKIRAHLNKHDNIERRELSMKRHFFCNTLINSLFHLCSFSTLVFGMRYGIPAALGKFFTFIFVFVFVTHSLFSRKCCYTLTLYLENTSGKKIVCYFYF